MRTCPICCDALRNPFLSTTLPCCRHGICRSCLHSHVSSVLGEGLAGGGGRTSLLCPVGCGAPMTDVQIRSTIRYHHFSFVRHVLVLGVLNLAHYAAYLPLMLCRFLLLGRIRSFDSRTLLRLASLMHRQKCTRGTTAAERAELRLYENWSVSVGVATRSQERREEEDVIRCPAPDCDHLWYASGPYRRSKMANEPNGGGVVGGSSSSSLPSSRSVPRRSLLVGGSGSTRALSGSARKLRHSIAGVASSILYHPPRPEAAEPGHLFWVDGYDVDSSKYFTSGREERDGRKVRCGKCRAEFCGLCRRPWTAVGRKRRTLGSSLPGPTVGTGGGKRVSHDNKSCAAFLRKTAEDGGGGDDDASYSFTAQAVRARCCPGCSVRVIRSDGCNHMACSCGTEWCYVCESNWNNWHYGCRMPSDDSSSVGGNAGRGSGCVVS